MTEITSAFIPMTEAETLVNTVNPTTSIKELSNLLAKAPLRAVLLKKVVTLKG